jgi:hypothetical protein
MYENIYYDGAFGLTKVGEWEWSEPDWSFDITAVWRKSRGKYYYASDAGCSCPTPFEDITSVRDLEGPYNKEELRKQLFELLDTRCDDKYHYGYPKDKIKEEILEVLSRL